MMRFSINLKEFEKVSLTIHSIRDRGSFQSRCSCLPCLGSRSNRNLYAFVGFQLKLIAYLLGDNKREFSHGLIIWCKTDFITTIHNQSHSTSHFKLVCRFLGGTPLFYFEKGIPASKVGKPGQEGVWLLGWDRIHPTRSTPPWIRVWRLDRQSR